MDSAETHISTLEELKTAAINACAAVGAPPENIIREIQKAEIIAAAERQRKRTGQRLPKDLKKRLAETYNCSEKEVENIVYRNT